MSTEGIYNVKRLYLKHIDEKGNTKARFKRYPTSASKLLLSYEPYIYIVETLRFFFKLAIINKDN